jgi:Protein of unknown function (DUF4238)
MCGSFASLEALQKRRVNSRCWGYRHIEMPPPEYEIPLFRHLREIADGTRPKPETSARRHHYVPSFLLARWARPQKRDGELFELLVPGGRPRRTTPDQSAFKRDLYAQDVGTTSPDLTVEGFLSIIEGYSAQPLKDLAQLPPSISDEDRATLAFFIAYQEARTPPALAQHRLNAHRAAQLVLAEFLGDPSAFAARYREKVDAEATDEEIGSFHAAELENFATGKRTIRIPSGAVLTSMMSVTRSTAAVIAMQDWTLLRAADGEFVMSDRAIAMFDPTPRFPWTGNAWQSSPNAQATIPLSPDVCLLMMPGDERFSTVTANARTVEDINLRMYGWAEQSIFGTSQDAVVRVHRAAKHNKKRVPRPRMPKQILVEAVDPSDKTVGDEHARRGWPRTLVQSDGHGKKEVLAYKIVDIEDDGVGGLYPKPEVLKTLHEAFGGKS